MVTSNVTDLLIKDVVDGDATTVRARVRGSHLDRADLGGRVLDGAPPAAPSSTPEARAAARRRRLDPPRSTSTGRTGRFVSGASVSPNGIGAGAAVGPSPATLEGRAPRAEIVFFRWARRRCAPRPTWASRRSCANASPIRDLNGKVLGVVSLWRDGGSDPDAAGHPPLFRGRDGHADRWALVAAVLLFFIFRSAQARLTRQTGELLEATRRDSLTGTLNHGALVALVAARIEAARSSGEAVGVALIDVDNFTLLNDNHGHRVGDAVLSAGARGAPGRACRPTRSSAGMGPTSSSSSLSAGPPSTRSSPAVQAVRDGPHPAQASMSIPAGSAADHPSAPASRPTRATVPFAARSSLSTVAADARDGQGERRRFASAWPAPRRRSGAGAASSLRRPPGPCLRRRHEGSLHEAPLGGCRPVRDLPRPAAGAGRARPSRRSAWRACSTTSGRSASRTRSCASPDR